VVRVALDDTPGARRAGGPRFLGDLVLVEELSGRELQVLRLVAGGARNHEIASSLRITVKTVEFHVSNIMGKLGARSRTESVTRAWQAGLLEAEPVAS
jgi:DNA-binding NarL/FixJ family response regulator